MLSPYLFIFINRRQSISQHVYLRAGNNNNSLAPRGFNCILPIGTHVTTLYAKRVIDQSYTLLSVNKTIVRCQNWVIVDLVHKRAAPKRNATGSIPRKTNSSSSSSRSPRPVFPGRHLEEAPSSTSLFPLVSHPPSPVSFSSSSSSFSSFSFLVQEAETIPTIVTSNRGY